MEFLKWFTEAGRNLEFSLGSGYVPVKKEANEMTFVEQAMDAGRRQFQNARHHHERYRHDGREPDVHYKSIQERHCGTCHPQRFHGGKGTGGPRGVPALTAEGMPHEEAAAQFVTDENFEAWYEETRTALEMCIAG